MVGLAVLGVVVLLTVLIIAVMLVVSWFHRCKPEHAEGRDFHEAVGKEVPSQEPDLPYPSWIGGDGFTPPKPPIVLRPSAPSDAWAPTDAWPWGPQHPSTPTGPEPVLSETWSCGVKPTDTKSRPSTPAESWTWGSMPSTSSKPPDKDPAPAKSHESSWPKRLGTPKNPSAPAETQPSGTRPGTPADSWAWGLKPGTPAKPAEMEQSDAILFEKSWIKRFWGVKRPATPADSQHCGTRPSTAESLSWGHRTSTPSKPFESDSSPSKSSERSFPKRSWRLRRPSTPADAQPNLARPSTAESWPRGAKFNTLQKPAEAATQHVTPPARCSVTGRSSSGKFSNNTVGFHSGESAPELRPSTAPAGSPRGTRQRAQEQVLPAQLLQGTPDGRASAELLISEVRKGLARAAAAPQGPARARAFRELQRQVHPDKHPDHRFGAKEAFQFLMEHQGKFAS